MLIREYNENDCLEITQLFYNTVHIINAKDYTKPQLDVWADGNADCNLWNDKFLIDYTLVAVENGKIVGFGNMDKIGYLDKLYVHHNYQRQKIATRIVLGLQNLCKLNTFTTYSSITAVKFFESLGYSIVEKNTVVRNNIELENYLMEFKLN